MTTKESQKSKIVTLSVGNRLNTLDVHILDQNSARRIRPVHCNHHHVTPSPAYACITAHCTSCQRHRHIRESIVLLNYTTLSPALRLATARKARHPFIVCPWCSCLSSFVRGAHACRRLSVVLILVVVCPWCSCLSSFVRGAHTCRRLSVVLILVVVCPWCSCLSSFVRGAHACRRLSVVPVFVRRLWMNRRLN